jgi:uncharacterized membrane protein YqaE (UPF0057 family)
MRYLLAIILPPVAALLYGKPSQFLLSMILTLLLWIPGVIYSLMIVNNYIEEERERTIAKNILTSRIIKNAIK